MTSKMNKLVSKLKNGVYIKTVALLLAVLFLSCGSVGGTIAWMVCQTDAVINTFTYGKIDITLTETDTKLDEDDNDKTNKLLKKLNKEL